MIKQQKLSHAIEKASPEAYALWSELNGATRVLFDAEAHEWVRMPIEQKIRLLRLLEQAHLLDGVVREYIVHYRTRTDPCGPLTGFGGAVEEYAKHGFVLNVPRSEPLFGCCIPITFYVAALAKMIEDDNIDRTDIAWLQHELHRLHSAIDKSPILAKHDFSTGFEPKPKLTLVGDDGKSGS